MKFSKPPKSYSEQIALLKKRGLIIDNDGEVLKILQNVNYYRLSAYYLPFQNRKDIFDKGTEFSTIFSLYKFDRNLRILFLDVIELIEISLRSKISYHLVHNYGPFKYLDKTIYERRFKFDKWVTKLKNDIHKTHEIFVNEYFKKYSDTSLPIWMAIEIISFGELSILYKYMLRHDRQKIAKDIYNIDEKAMVSWVHSLVYIRNLCAHHSRLWNRNLSVAPQILKSDQTWDGINNRKVFAVVLMCKHLCPDLSYWEKWIYKLLALIKKYAPDINQMGFPANWNRLLVR